jgi:hypothetical protein
MVVRLPNSVGLFPGESKLPLGTRVEDLFIERDAASIGRQFDRVR